MSCIQVNACPHSLCKPSLSCATPTRLYGLRKTTLRLTNTGSAHLSTSLKLTTSESAYPRCTPVCLFGGKGKSASGDEVSPWKSLEKAMGGLKKEQSLEDVLRQQIEKQEYSDDGGSGGNRSGGDGNNSGGPEGESPDGILDETLQVILATMGFIFLYMYIIDGEDLTRLAKDYIKFFFSGKKSIRLSRSMYQWGKFYQRQTRKKEIQPDWLEREILNTHTWYDSPTKYKRILMAYLASTSNE